MSGFSLKATVANAMEEAASTITVSCQEATTVSWLGGRD